MPYEMNSLVIFAASSMYSIRNRARMTYLFLLFAILAILVTLMQTSTASHILGKRGELYANICFSISAAIYSLRLDNGKARRSSSMTALLSSYLSKSEKLDRQLSTSLISALLNEQTFPLSCSNVDLSRLVLFNFFKLVWLSFFICHPWELWHNLLEGY